MGGRRVLADGLHMESVWEKGLNKEVVRTNLVLLSLQCMCDVTESRMCTTESQQ